MPSEIPAGIPKGAATSSAPSSGSEIETLVVLNMQAIARQLWYIRQLAEAQVSSSDPGAYFEFREQVLQEYLKRAQQGKPVGEEGTVVEASEPFMVEVPYKSGQRSKTRLVVKLLWALTKKMFVVLLAAIIGGLVAIKLNGLTD